MANENDHKSTQFQQNWLLVGAVLVVAVALTVNFLQRPSAGESNNSNPLTGKIAPDITYEFPQGVKSSLAQNRGKAILVNFWASWCEPCMEEMSSLAALEARFAKKPFLLLAFNVDEDSESVETQTDIAGRHMPQNLIFRFPKSLLSPYELTSIPLSVLIDPKGAIRSVYLGPREWTDAESVQEVEAVLR